MKTLEILTAVSAKREKEKWFDLVPDPPQLYRLWQPNGEYTMWKFQDFSATQVLGEINFGDIKGPKTAILTTYAVLNFEFLATFDIFKCEFFS